MKLFEKKLRPRTILYLSLITLAILAIIWILFSFNKKGNKKNKYAIPFLNEKSGWADSTLAKMTIDEKIGQLIIMQIDSTISNIDSTKILVKKFAFGGMILKEDSLFKMINLLALSLQIL